jgi:hypothetical protein
MVEHYIFCIVRAQNIAAGIRAIYGDHFNGFAGLCRVKAM